MSRYFFGLTLPDSVSKGDFKLKRTVLSENQSCWCLSFNDFIPYLDPSHKAIIDAMESKCEFHIEIPEVQPEIDFTPEDIFVVLEVSNLPKLDDTRTAYTDEEIENAKFVFVHYCVE